MNAQIIKSPTRVDLAGGFLDIWPVHALVKDCCVVNFSIPIFSSATCEYREDKACHFEIHSYSGSYKQSFSHSSDFLKEEHPQLRLLQKHYEHWNKTPHSEKGISLKIITEAPIGSGLGGSSSLCVTLNKMFAHQRKQEMSEMEMIYLCRDLESSVLHSLAGTQDYIPALEPEPYYIYMIEYNHLGPKWKKQKLPKDFIEEHIVLVNTKQAHHSGQANWEILKNILENDQTILTGIHQLRDNALAAVALYEKKNWGDFMEILKKEYLLRSTIFPQWINKFLSQLCNAFMDNGAQAVKLCGAGGGGVLLVFTKNKEQKQKVENLCQKQNLPILLK